MRKMRVWRNKDGRQSAVGSDAEVGSVKSSPPGLSSKVPRSQCNEGNNASYAVQHLTPNDSLKNRNKNWEMTSLFEQYDFLLNSLLFTKNNWKRHSAVTGFEPFKNWVLTARFVSVRSGTDNRTRFPCVLSPLWYKTICVIDRRTFSSLSSQSYRLKTELQACFHAHTTPRL